MGTAYTITIGYLSGYSYGGDKDDAWDELVQCVEALREQPERLVAEARRLNAPETCNYGCCTLENVAETYRAAFTHGNPLTINYDQRYIMQMATGDRAQKEHVRRAFCRLLIEEMHRKGIEVCLTVS